MRTMASRRLVGFLRPTTTHPKATTCLAKDRTALLAFYDFPAAH